MINFRIFLQETYAIEDCYFNWDCTSSNQNVTGTANQVTYSNDGMYLKSSTWSDLFVNVPFPKGATVEFTAKNISGSSGHSNYFNLKAENTSTNLWGGSFRGTGWYVDKPTPTVNGSYTAPVNFKLEILIDGTVNLYVNNVLANTKTISTSSNLIFYWGTGTSSYCTIKDVKIKAL